MNVLHTNYGPACISIKEDLTYTSCTCLAIQWNLNTVHKIFDDAPIWYQYINAVGFFKISIGNWHEWATSRSSQIAFVPVSPFLKHATMVPLVMQFNKKCVFRKSKNSPRQLLDREWAATSSRYGKNDTLDLIPCSMLLSCSQGSKNPSKKQRCSFWKFPAHSPLNCF